MRKEHVSIVKAEDTKPKIVKNKVKSEVNLGGNILGGANGELRS